jgi:Tfp pilus assembly protein PilF
LPKGNEAETVSDWYMAKYLYQIAYQLDPENKDIPVKIASLKNKIKTESQIHFQQGLDFYQNGEIKNARQALLTALRINPEHKNARIYLLDIVQQPEENKFTVNQKNRLGNNCSRVLQ